jgi:recombination protein RecA
MAKKKKESEFDSLDGVFRLSSLLEKDKSRDPKSFFSTGSYCLNRLLTGSHECGIPRDRFVEIYGPEGVGKTTFCIHAAADATKRKEHVYWFDFERALDVFYVLALGVDPDYFHLVKPICTEDAFDKAKEILELQNPGLFVFDSAAAMIPMAEVDGDMNKEDMGLRAKKIKRGILKILAPANDLKVGCIIINQFMSNIGGYGKTEKTVGGNAVRQFCSTRLEIRSNRSQKIEGKVQSFDLEAEKEAETGKRILCRTEKNRLNPPYMSCEVDLVYGHGIDKKSDYVRFLDSVGIIDLSWTGKKTIKKIIYDGNNYTKKTFFRKLTEDKEFKKEIKKLIKEKTK